MLDRPNPVGGTARGPLLQPGFRSGVGMDAVALVHGLTLGELARFVDGELHLAGRAVTDLAREGAEFELAGRRVLIHSAEVTDAPDSDHVELTIRTGKGVYVRSVARDLAAAEDAYGCDPQEAPRPSAEAADLESL